MRKCCVCRCVCVCARAVRTPVRRTLRSSSAPSTRRVYRALEKESGGRGGKGEMRTDAGRGRGGRQMERERHVYREGASLPTRPACGRARAPARLCESVLLCVACLCFARRARAHLWLLERARSVPILPSPPGGHPRRICWSVCVFLRARDGALVPACAHLPSRERARARALARARDQRNQRGRGRFR